MVEVFKVYCGNEGKGYLKVIFCVCVIWVVDIFPGCSGFGCKWVIWEFSFKSAVSSVSAGRCFGGCG